MSIRSKLYQSIDENGGQPTAPQTNGTPTSALATTDKRIGRKSWITLGTRLNAEMTLQNVRMTDIVVGSGSFGARDVRVAEWYGTRVAAKTLMSPTMDCPESPAESSLDFGRNITPYQRRVLQECNLMGRLCHPHIAQLHGVFVDVEGRPVIISELMCESLAQRFAYGARLTFRDVMDAGSQVLSALSYIHSLPHAVVHGSLCSNNVLMSSTGVVKLTDTNLALARLHSPCATTGHHGNSATHVDLPRRGHEQTQHSENAELYMPVSSSQDSHDTTVDCFSFAILLMAMCLHREPCVSPIASSTQVSELERRAHDLEALRHVTPLVEPLVTVCIDDGFVHRSGANSSVSQRPNAHELLKNINEIRSSDEYRKWPCTLGSVFNHGSQRQTQLEDAMRAMQGQVKLTVQAAQAAIDEQNEKVSQQIRQLVSLHSAQTSRLRKRLDEARLRVQEAHVAEARERSERRSSEAVRDSLAKQLESLRCGSSSPRSLTASFRHGHSDPDAGDEVSTDGGDIPLSPLCANGHNVSSLSVDDIDAGNQDYSEVSMEVSVQMPHDGVKLVSVEDCLTVQEIIQSLCEVNCLPDPDGYCMYIDVDDYSLVKRSSSKSYKTAKARKFDIWKRKSMAEEPLSNGAILNNECTLDQQGIHPHPHLLLQLRRRSHIYALNGECDRVSIDSMEDECDTEFCKCKENLACGALLCTHEEAVNLLAFYAQAMYGDHSQLGKEQIKGVTEAMKEAVSCITLKSKNTKKLMHQYGQLSGVSMVVAKRRFVQLCQGLPAYGAVVFQVKERISKKDKGKPCILALTQRTMFKMDEKTKAVNQTWWMKNIFRARATGELLTVEAPERPTLIVSSPDATEIANLINKHKTACSSSNAKASSPPGLTVMEATPKHSPLRQSLSNNTIIHTSPKSSPRLVQQLSIRRTESATVIRKVSPNGRFIRHASDHPQGPSPLRSRSQSTSSMSKGCNRRKSDRLVDPSHAEVLSDSSEDVHLAQPLAPSSLPTFGGSNPLLSSSGRGIHRNGTRK